MECAGSIPEADLILSALITLIHVDCTGVCLQLFAVVLVKAYTLNTLVLGHPLYPYVNPPAQIAFQHSLVKRFTYLYNCTYMYL